MDTALKQDEPGNILSLSEKFEENLTIVIGSLKSLEPEEKKAASAMKGKNRKTDPVLIKSNEIGQVLKEMKALLEKKRAHGWKLMDTLLNLLPDAGFYEEKMTLERAMTRLDTQTALSILSKLAYKLNISLKGN